MQTYVPRRILILDDEPMICKALSRTLESHGYTTFVASTPHEALDCLANEKVDMVISDHLMPNMNGFDLLKIVRERHPDCIRVMLTGNADMQTAMNAIHHGEIYQVLTKPWDLDELLVTLFIAFDHLDLKRENQRLQETIRRQNHAFTDLERRYPGITPVARDADGAVVFEAA